MKDDKYLVTGSKDSELRVWKVYFPDTDDVKEKTVHPLVLETEEEQDDSSVVSTSCQNTDLE